MHRLIYINSENDIPDVFKDTPVANLLQYHNLNYTFQTYENAQILVGMCIDNRKQLRLPDNFAYIIRSGGANVRYSDFYLSYAVAVGGVRYIALIGHNDCGMVKLLARKDQFINGFMDATKWDEKKAEDYFMYQAPFYEIFNEIDFTLTETKRLREIFKGVTIVPMLYNVFDKKLCLISE